MVLGLYITKGLVRYKGKYLLLKKAKDILPENNGKWECSGGKIKEKEDPQEAILREIKAETGLECKIAKELPILHMRNEKVDSVCRVYVVDAPSDKIKLGGEHSDYKWLKPGEVKKMELVMFADLLLKYFNNAEEYGL